MGLVIFDKRYILETISTFLIPIIFLFIFYIYIKKINYNKKEILFYSPILLIAFLFLFRITAFIPILNYIYPDVYNNFLIFFTLFIFFKNFKLNRLFIILITMLSILSVTINLTYTPFFIEHTQLEKDTLEIMKDIKTNFLVTKTYSTTSYGKAYYSYAPIYLNISTPFGWEKVATKDYQKTLINFFNVFDNRNCSELRKAASKLKNDYVISYNQDCEFLQSCNLKEINRKNSV